MSFIKKIFSSAYDELWKAIIRPNRDIYQDIELGPEKFDLKGKCYKRTDFTLRNKKNYKLACSHWEPFDEEREYPKLPCVIYLHGNSSSRCEVVPEIKYLLLKGITVFSFDFSGCGRSEGEYISLGWHEQDDVACVVDFLRRSNKVSSIGLWGRSMGAATALMYSTKDLSIAGLVLDSPFSSLKTLINELAKDRVALPDFVVRQAIKWIKETIKEKADFNLDDVEPKDYAEKCFIPAYFCHSKEDTFVNIHHCKDLYNLYSGDKNIVYVRGNHNSERSIHFKDSVAQFFYKALRCKEMEQTYQFHKLSNLEFEFYQDDNNFCKKILDLKKRKNKKTEKKINNSVSEIKISGKIENKKDNDNSEDKNDSKIIEEDCEVIYTNDDNIFIHNINECPKLKTNSEYINYKKMNNKSNKNPILKKFPKSASTKDVTLENQSKNEKNEIIQLRSNLSTKELDDININTPNLINNNNRISLKKYNHMNLEVYKAKKNNNKYNEYNKKKNETIPYDHKYRFISNLSINNMNRTVNQSDINHNKKINHVKYIKGKRNYLLAKLRNKNDKNNALKNKLNIKIPNKNNNINASSTKYPSPIQPDLTFPNFILQIKNYGHNLKQINNQKNINKENIHQIYNRKNKGNNNFKINIKGNKEKEEYKSISINKDKKIINISTGKQIFNKKNKNLIKYNKKKEENSKDNNSEKTYKNNENKLSSSHYFKENEDDFFLEEDSIKINIPHV